MTATRGAILVAVIAAGCSVLLAVDSAYGRMSTTMIAPMESWDCTDTAGAGTDKPRDIATHTADGPSAVQ